MKKERDKLCVHFLCVADAAASCLPSFFACFIISSMRNDVVYWININNVLNAFLIHKKNLFFCDDGQCGMLMIRKKIEILLSLFMGLQLYRLGYIDYIGFDFIT